MAIPNHPSTSVAKKYEPMSAWYRVFGMNEKLPDPREILDYLRSMAIQASAQVEGDDLGWFAMDLAWGEPAEQIRLERFLAKEEGIRAELNTWAAWLETLEDQPMHEGLMERVIRTSQIIAWQSSAGAGQHEDGERVHVGLSQFLARQTEGVYQADGRGFFAADGALLVRES